MNPGYLGHAFTPHELKDRIADVQHLKLGEGRPHRDTCIGADDILNLRIALNTSTSIEEFIGRV